MPHTIHTQTFIPFILLNLSFKSIFNPFVYPFLGRITELQSEIVVRKLGL